MGRTYHHGNLREALIAEGIKLIEAEGVNSLTLREIGVKAGVSRTAAYRHFGDKSELLGAISEAAFSAFADTLQAARTSAGPSHREQLAAMGLAYSRFAQDHRAYYQVMFGLGCDPGQSAAGSAAGDRAFALLVDTIRDGQAAGEFRDGDAEQMAKVVWALSHGVVTLGFANVIGEGDAVARFTATAGDLLRKGIDKP